MPVLSFAEEELARRAHLRWRPSADVLRDALTSPTVALDGLLKSRCSSGVQ